MGPIARYLVDDHARAGYAFEDFEV